MRTRLSAFEDDWVCLTGLLRFVKEPHPEVSEQLDLLRIFDSQEELERHMNLTARSKAFSARSFDEYLACRK